MHNVTHIGLVVARVLIAGMGFLLIYVAFFLYENEEGRLQNRLEELWVWIDELQKRALAANKTLVAFFVESLKVVQMMLKMIEDLPSWNRSTFSRLLMITMLVAVAVITRIIATMEGVFIVRNILHYNFLAAVISTAGLSWGGIAKLLCITTPGYILLWWVFYHGVGRFQWLIRHQFFIILVISIVVAFAFFIWFFTPVASTYHLALLRASLLLTLYPEALGSPITIALGLVLVMNRLLWPIISRPLYAIARHELMKKRALLLLLAFMLLTWSIPAWKPFWDVMGKLK